MPYRTPQSTSAHLTLCETRVGKSYCLNLDRNLVDVTVPIFAVVDSECDDGNAGDTVISSLLDARSRLRRAVRESPTALEAALLESIQNAHAQLVAIPKGAPGYAGGAAATVFAVSQDVGVIAHVGDCRLYVREHSGWVRKTKDHTQLEQLRAHGMVPDDPARELEIIVRTIGAAPTCTVDTARVDVCAGLEVLMCTRGAWMPSDPTGLATPLPRDLDGLGAANLLLDNYVLSGEKDNATIVVVRFDA